MNKLFFGENLEVLRELVSESVDLIYLDPPFNSKRDYNIIFQSPTGAESSAQITAFEDSWHWGEQAEKEYHELLHGPNPSISEMISSFRRFLGQNDMMAYLVMMANRLIELHRVLKSTGSLYLHCDPTASHYLKVLLDTIFGKEGFKNEITWKRTSGHSDAKRYGSNTDIVFFYTKTNKFTFNICYQPYDEEYLTRFRNQDANGRRWTDGDITAKGLSGGGYEYEYKGITSLWRCPMDTMQRLDTEGRLHFTSKGGIRLKKYLDELPGMPCQALWDDIHPLNSQAKERLGYPTQKPLALLERIIQVSSNEGDVVLDPFCGCGTAVHAAHKLNREWIGIDITHLAISLIEKRLNEAFPSIEYEVEGTPKDLEGARNLALRDKYQFQWWACSLVGAQPYQGKKKGADGGIDGLIFFNDSDLKKQKTGKILVSIKGGEHVSLTMLKDLIATVQGNNADMGLFVTLAKPTRPMALEALKAGYYSAGNGKRYPKIQILSVEGLISGAEKPEYYDMSMGQLTCKKAQRDKSKDAVKQTKLQLDFQEGKQPKMVDEIREQGKARLTKRYLDEARAKSAKTSRVQGRPRKTINP